MESMQQAIVQLQEQLAVITERIGNTKPKSTVTMEQTVQEPYLVALMKIDRVNVIPVWSDRSHTKIPRWIDYVRCAQRLYPQSTKGLTGNIAVDMLVRTRGEVESLLTTNKTGQKARFALNNQAIPTFRKDIVGTKTSRTQDGRNSRNNSLLAVSDKSSGRRSLACSNPISKSGEPGKQTKGSGPVSSVRGNGKVSHGDSTQVVNSKSHPNEVIMKRDSNLGTSKLREVRSCHGSSPQDKVVLFSSKTRVRSKSEPKYKPKIELNGSKNDILKTPKLVPTTDKDAIETKINVKTNTNKTLKSMVGNRNVMAKEKRPVLDVSHTKREVEYFTQIHGEPFDTKRDDGYQPQSKMKTAVCSEDAGKSSNRGNQTDGKGEEISTYD